MIIEKDRVVSIHYILKNGQEGEIIEQTASDRPFQFLIGSDIMLPAFEQAIFGKQAGNEFEILIPCEQAYKQPQVDSIIKVSKKEFEDERGEFPKNEIKEGTIVNIKDKDDNIHETGQNPRKKMR